MKRILFTCLALCAVLMSIAQEVVSEEQLYFTVTPSRTRVYEQEAVLLTYRFHVFGNMGLSVGMNSKPDFQGLVSQEIPQPENKSVYTETINGRVQRAGVVKQSLVFPQRPGRITIPGLTFNCEVRVGTDALGAALKLKRRVPDVTIDVDPLPVPAPPSFGGAVGHFEIKPSAPPAALETGDIATRSITVNGQGNLRLIAMPRLAFPSGIETFDITTDDHVRVSAEGMNGSITFNYPFMPRTAGDYTLPADTFCYFDPQVRDYRFIVLPAVPLKVVQGERSREEMEAEAELRRSDIRPDHELQNASHIRGWGIWLWMAGGIVLFVLFVLTNNILLRRSKVKAVWRGVAGAESRANKGLHKAVALFDNGDRTAALAVLETTMLGFAAEYVPSALSSDHNALAEAMRAKGFDTAAVEEWIAVLTEIDKSRFAPVSANGGEEQMLLQRATDVLQRLMQKQ